MSQNNKGLGRGLDALFHGARVQEETEQPMPQSDSPFIMVSCNLLAPNPNQPRSSFSEEKLRELGESMKTQGILQPILIRPGKTPGTYQIIAGERRWRAARLAGIEKIPAIIRDLDDGEALVTALIENVQREDLNPIEKAKALVKLKDTLMISQESLAEKLGQSRGSISNLLRLLRLSETAQDDLINGRMDPGHARCLLSIDDPEAVEQLRQRIVDKNLTVREAEEAVNFWRTENRFPWAGKTKPDLEEEIKKLDNKEMSNLATQISASMNCRTKIRGDINKGHISLVYESNEQLFDILDKLGLTISG